MIESVFGIFLGTWFLLSLLTQIRIDSIQRLRKWDLLGLLPMWWFFAPIPARGDIHLLYRCQLQDCTVLDWREIRPGGRRNWFSLIWNPGRRERKALFDISNGLLAERRAKGVDTSDISLSLTYLLLLNYVVYRTHVLGTKSVQLMLMSSDLAITQDEPKLIFLSGWHNLFSDQSDMYKN